MPGNDPFLSGESEHTFQNSSNVGSSSYDPRNAYLEIGYKNGSRYGYHGVSPSEAQSFRDAPSPGSWVWDHLRQRGTVFGYQKPYAYIGGSSTGSSPKYYGSSIYREQHRNIGPGGAVPQSWYAGGPYSSHFMAAGHGFSPSEVASMTHRKVPMAYGAPSSKKGFFSRLWGGLKGYLHMASGGTVPEMAGIGPDEDEVPIRATAGEYVETREERAMIDHLLGRDSSRHTGIGEHFASGGVIGSLLNFGKSAGSTKSIGATLGGYLGFGGGLIGALLGGVGGSSMAGGGMSGTKSPGDALVEAANELKEAANQLKGTSPQNMGPGGMGPPNPFVNANTGMPFLNGMSPMANAAPGAGAAGAGGAMAGLEAAAGPIGLAIMAAEAVNSMATKVADGFGDASDAAIGLSKSMMQTIGVPKSIVELGGAVMNLVSPLKGAEIGIKAMQFALAPMLNLDKPGEIVKDVFTSIGAVGQKLVTVFMDLRDPAQMLSQAISPFVNQVNKFNPGLVERMNIAFDNVSAAAGRMFEPIIDAVTGFADEMNMVYTELQGPVRSLVSEFVQPMIGWGRELLVGFAGLVQEGVPVVRQLMSDLAPLAPVARQLIGGFFELTGAAVKFGGSLISGVMDFIGPMIDHGRSLIGILMEWWRTMGTVTGTIFEMGAQIRSAVTSIFGGMYSAFDSAIGAVQNFTAAMSATASAMRDIVNHWQWMVRNPNQAGELVAGNWQADFRRAMERMQAPSATAPISGRAMTYAANQARHVGIEDVGLEARRAAFSMGRDNAQETADNTRATADVAREILQRLGNLPDIARIIDAMRATAALVNP